MSLFKLEGSDQSLSGVRRDKMPSQRGFAGHVNMVSAWEFNHSKKVTSRRQQAMQQPCRLGPADNWPHSDAETTAASNSH